MGIPTFDYVPIIGNDAGTARLRVVSLTGVPTKHASAQTDRGRLYAKVTKPAGDYQLDLYSDMTRATLVATGTTPTLETYFALAAAGGSGVTGRAMVESYAADHDDLIVLPTFAVDADVFLAAADTAALPGYDATYGLAELHAQAMRTILASSLPAALPMLFGGTGLSAFVPNKRGVELPDLTKIANADELRVAQGHLVRALCAEQKPWVDQWGAVAKDARARYEQCIREVMAANVREESQDGVTVSTYGRG